MKRLPSSLKKCIGKALLSENSLASMLNILLITKPSADVGYVISSNLFVQQVRKFLQIQGGKNGG